MGNKSKQEFVPLHLYKKIQDENKLLKKLLKYVYNLPMNEADDYDEYIKWQAKVKQILEDK